MKVDVLYSNLVKNVFSNYESSEDPVRLFRPECVGVVDFKSKNMLSFFGPMTLGLLVFLTWAGSLAAQRVLKRDLEMNKSRTLGILFSVMFTFFAGISMNALSLFNCNGNPNGKETLNSDPSILCWEDEWRSVLAFAILSVLLYILAYGALLCRAVITAPRFFSSKDFRMRWKFLFIKFRPDVWWWSLVICIKGVGMNVGLTFVTNGLGQLYWMFGTMATYTMGVFCFMPWRHRLTTALEVHIDFALMLVVCLCSYHAVRQLYVGLQSPEADSIRDQVDLALVIVNLTPAPVGLVLFACLYKSIKTRASSSEVLVKQCMPSMQLLCKAETSKVVEFIADLDDWARYELLCGLRVIATELSGEMVKQRLSDGPWKGKDSISTSAPQVIEEDV
jgi:hypothetical protein